MLQQTQVQTVIPFFRSFLEAFPNFQALADANPQDLLRAWAGLGYYARVRYLQKTAREIVKNHGGRFPSEHRDLLGLPGIGRYTAGAILSIAFNRPYPVVDGNVTRVLSRLFLLTEDSQTSKFKENVWNLAGQLLSRKSPGNFNQALMELGATICSPRSPACLLCPWSSECLARQEGVEDQLPRKTVRPGRVESQQAVAIVGHQGRYLIVKRKGVRVLCDFWEFPGYESRRTGELKRSLVSRIRRDLGLKIHVKEKLVTVKHIITKHRITVHAYLAELNPSERRLTRRGNARWVRLSEIERYPFGSASTDILNALKKRVESGYSI